MGKIHYFVYVVLFLAFVACNNTNMSTVEREKEAILKIHNLQRDYHLNKLAKEFTDLFSEEFVSIGNGTISKPTKEESFNRFNNYFENVEFEKWDDITQPEIRFSNDFSIAYTFVNKDVTISYKNGNGNLVKEKTVFAWVAIYKKVNDEWKIDCVTSTNKPSISL